MNNDWFKKGKKSDLSDDVKEKKKSTDLFVMMNNFFKDNEWKKYSLYEKSRNFFMINRYMSINYPIQSAIFSRNGIVGGHVVEFWRNVFIKQFKSMPNWIYTKTKKKSKEDKIIDFSKFGDDVIEYFYNINKCSYKELNEAKKLYPEQLFEELTKIENMMKSYSTRK